MDGFENNSDQEMREYELATKTLENLKNETKNLEAGIQRLEKGGNSDFQNNNFNDISNVKEQVNELIFEETKYKEQIANNSVILDKVRTDVAIFQDTHSLKQTSSEKHDNLMEERELLGRKKSLFQEAVNEKSREIHLASNAIHGNKNFAKIEKLENDLKNAAKICVDKEDMVLKKLADDATPIISGVEQLSNDHNTWLVDRLQRGVGIQIE